MSRAAKATLLGSIVASGLTVWAVHFMQIQERATMYKGVERDEARQAAKKAQREADLVANREREAEFQKMQPTRKQYIASSIVEEAERSASKLKSKASQLLEQGAGVGDREDRAYITGRWAFNGVQIGAVAATPLYLLASLRRGSFTMKRLVRANWTTPVAGGLLGAGSGVLYSQSLEAPKAAKVSYDYRHSSDVVRRDDLYIIGGAVGALLTPAVLRSAGLFNGLLGGGLGLGGSLGMGSDYIRRLTSGEESLEDLQRKGSGLVKGVTQQVEDARRAAEEGVGSAAKKTTQ